MMSATVSALRDLDHGTGTTAQREWREPCEPPAVRKGRTWPEGGVLSLNLERGLKARQGEFVDPVSKGRLEPYAHKWSCGGTSTWLRDQRMTRADPLANRASHEGCVQSRSHHALPCHSTGVRRRIHIPDDMKEQHFARGPTPALQRGNRPAPRWPRARLRRMGKPRRYADFSVSRITRVATLPAQRGGNDVERCPAGHCRPTRLRTFRSAPRADDAGLGR